MLVAFLRNKMTTTEQHLRDIIEEQAQRISEMRSRYVQENFLLQRKYEALLDELVKLELTKPPAPIIIKK